MGRFVGRRLVAALFLLLGITLVTFVLTNVVPGDPAAANLGQRAINDPEAVAQQAATSVDDAERGPLYQQFQQGLNESGPFFPLFQPEAAVVSVTDRVTGASFDPSLTLDVRGLAPA